MSIITWSGRLGNHLHQIGHAMMAARLAGTRTIYLGKDLRNFAEEKSLFTWGDSIELDVSSHPVNQSSRWKVCYEKGIKSYQKPGGGFMGGFWDTFCRASPAAEYRALMMQNIKTRMTPELRSCADQNGPEGDAEDLLTIHLRGDDLWAPETAPAAFWDKQPATPYVWGQPPCSMYEKILNEAKGKYKRMLIVTSPDKRNPCIQRLQESAKRRNMGIRIQSDTLLKDSCALLQAKHMVLSFSTLPESLVLMSSRIKTIYSREAFQYYSMMDCEGWQGVQVYQYETDVQMNRFAPFKNSYRGAKEWMLNYPINRIRGPGKFCKIT